MNKAKEDATHVDYDNRYKEIYGIGAEHYDRLRFNAIRGLLSKERKNEAIVNVLEKRDLLTKETRIIDVASGTGRIAHALIKEDVSHVYSVDITKEMLVVNKLSLKPRSQRKLSWIVADMKELPFSKSVFDVATLGSFFYLIPQDQYAQYASDIYRVLKPDGILIAEISNALHLMNPKSFLRIFGHKHFKRKPVKSYVYAWNARRLFKHFDVEEILGIDYPMVVSNDELHSKLSRLFGRFPITRYVGGKLILVMRKI